MGNCSPLWKGVNKIPIYAYECSSHGRFEVRQPMADERKANCPECDKPAEPRISACIFRFAEPFSVYAHDGTLLHRRQTTEKTPPPDYRWGKESNLVEV